MIPVLLAASSVVLAASADRRGSVPRHVEFIPRHWGDEIAEMALSPYAGRRSSERPTSEEVERAGLEVKSIRDQIEGQLRPLYDTDRDAYREYVGVVWAIDTLIECMAQSAEGRWGKIADDSVKRQAELVTWVFSLGPMTPGRFVEAPPHLGAAGIGLSMGHTVVRLRWEALKRQFGEPRNQHGFVGPGGWVSLAPIAGALEDGLQDYEIRIHDLDQTEEFLSWLDRYVHVHERRKVLP
jgi:hypothetical protein